jgi:hypothetical protein
MRRLAALLSLTTVLAFAAPAAGAPVPPFPKLPGKWSHALINVTIGRKAHTLILDRGRVLQSSTSQLTIREPYHPEPVPLSNKTIVVIDGVRSTVYSLSKGMNVQTMRIDGGAAVRVRATT